MQWPSPRVIVRAYLVSFALWFGVALLMGLQYRTPDHNHFWPWLAQFVSEAALRAVNLGFWTPPIFYLVSRYLRLSKGRVRYWFAWSLGAFPFVLLHTTFLWILVPDYDPAKQIYLPRTFQSWWDTIRHGFADQILVYILIVVAAHAYEYLKRLRSEERDRYEYQQALAASELQALKMQLHPHFLFNTLVGVSTLVDVDAEKAKLMILKLSSLLRTVLAAGSYDLIPLESELKFVREYLDLEKMRFGNRLETLWTISPEASRFLVPQMILQPLVENAIRHGIAPAREGGWVEVEVAAQDGILGIHVRNSTSGNGGNGGRGTGLGLRNVEARLKHLYAGKANFHLNLAEDHTATASLMLPAIECSPASFEHAFEVQN
jgi:two-component system, LytTR family, sensor kinase